MMDTDGSVGIEKGKTKTNRDKRGGKKRGQGNQCKGRELSELMNLDRSVIYAN